MSQVENSVGSMPDGGGNVVATPSGVTRPMPLYGVYQRFPSGPVAMLKADAGTGISVMVPSIVIRPTFPTADSLNQSAPSGPTVMPWMSASAVGTGNSVIDCAAENVATMNRNTKPKPISAGRGPRFGDPGMTATSGNGSWRDRTSGYGRGTTIGGGSWASGR